MNSGNVYTAASVQSSILQPRLRPDDLKFVTMGMFGGPNTYPILNKSAIRWLPGSNATIVGEASVFESLLFSLYRNILAILFALYARFLYFAGIVDTIDGNFQCYFWWLITLLPLPEDISYNGPISAKHSILHPQLKSSKLSKSSFSSVHQLYYNILELPTRIGNFALSQSLANCIPRDRLTIRQAMGGYYLPNHMVFIYDMIPLVVRPASEIPIPYLTAEKKMVIPDKKDIAKALVKRTEWASAHHTHKASETIRIASEAARCIAWSACSGLKLITLYEFNGYSWKDLNHLASMIQEEMTNLTKENYSVNDSITLISLNTGEVNKVFKPETCQMFHQAESLMEIEPTPELVSPPEVDGLSNETIRSSYTTFNTDLTVFLLSAEGIEPNTMMKQEIKENIISLLGPNRKLLLDDLMFAPKQYYKDYSDPNAIVKFTSERQMKYSLNGFPLVNQEKTGVVFLSDVQQANFRMFVETISLYTKVVKQNNLFDLNS